MLPILGLVHQNQSGPPDLEEMVKQFLRRLRKNDSNLHAFSRHGSNNDGNDNNNQLPAAIVNLLLIIVLVIMIFGFIASGLYTVDQSERALTFRFGKPIGISQPGLRWVIPFIDDYKIVNLSGVRTVEVGYRGNQKSKIASESLMLTNNQNIIDMQFAVQYILKNPEDFLYNNREPESAVLQVAETAMREVVGRSGIDFALYEGREAIAADTQSVMQEILDRYSTGILIQQVAIQNVQPPDQVQSAFEDAIKAGQDRDRKKNEGEAYRNDVVPKAQGSKSRILEDAEAYRLSRVALAKGVASRFSQLAEEFYKSPDVTRQRLYLDTIQDVFSRTNKILLDQKEGSNSLIYLPLDRILSSSPGNRNESNLRLTPSPANRSNQSSNSSVEQLRAEIRNRLSNNK